MYSPGLNEPIPVFEPLPPDTVSLSIQHFGPGEVSRISGFHPRGSLITLTALPGARVLNSTEREGIAVFTSWSGSIQSSDPVLTFRADSNMVVRATFAGAHDRSFIYAIPSNPEAQAQTSTNLTKWTPATDTYRFRGILRYDSLIDSTLQFFRTVPPP
jgi:hypothetical protein